VHSNGNGNTAVGANQAARAALKTGNTGSGDTGNENKGSNDIGNVNSGGGSSNIGNENSGGSTVGGRSSNQNRMIDYLFENGSRYLLVDEIDKTAPKDQAFLLNLMETGIVSETKYGKTRSAQIKTLVFATSNDIKRLSAPLQSRFLIVKIEPYTYEQFCNITESLQDRRWKEELGIL
jgi:MoxR-like ATPase